MRAVGENFILAKIYTYMVLDRCMCLSTCTFVLSDTSAGHFAPSQQPISVFSSTVNHSTHTVLTSCHYASLIQQLSSDAAKWREIGIYLGFSANELNVIQSKPALFTEAPTSWLQEILSQWLQWAPGDSRGSTSYATLENLKIALSRAGLGATAHHLKV